MRGLDTYIHRFTILLFFALFVGKDYREREREEEKFVILCTYYH